MFFILLHILKHKSDILLTLLLNPLLFMCELVDYCGQREHSRPKREKQGCTAQKGCNTEQEAEKEADDAYPRRLCGLKLVLLGERKATKRLLEGGDSVTVTLAGV